MQRRHRPRIVGDQDDRALVGSEGVEDLLARCRVEVVRRLIEEEHVRSGNHERRKRESRLLTAGEHRDGLVDVVAGEEELAEDVPKMRLIELGSGVRHVVPHARRIIEGLMLLRVVAELEAVTGDHLARIRRLDARKKAQQGRLARAVETEDHDLRAAVDRKIHAREHLEGPVRLRQALRRQGHPPRGRRIGEAQTRHLLLDGLGADLGEEFIRPAQHLLGSHGLRRLRPHLLALGAQLLGLLHGVRPFLATAPLVLLALEEVGRPPEVVHVDLGPRRIQVEDLVDGLPQQLDVVGDHHDPAGEGLDPVPQPQDRIVVEVVRRLVEEQDVRAGEEHAGEFHAAPLPAGQGIQALLEDAVLEPQRMGDLSGLGVRRPPSLRGELLIEAHVALHRLDLPGALGRSHLVLGLTDLRDDLVDAAHGDDALPRAQRLLSDVRVLGEVADGAVRGDRTLMLGRPLVPLTGEEPHRRGLARTVAADETDPHALVDAEVRMTHEIAGADAQREVRNIDHPMILRVVGRYTPIRLLDSAQVKAQWEGVHERRGPS